MENLCQYLIRLRKERKIQIRLLMIIIIITHFQLIAGTGKLSDVVSFGKGQPVEIIILIFIAGSPAQSTMDNRELVLHLEDVPYQIIRITVVLDKETSPASLFFLWACPSPRLFLLHRVGLYAITPRREPC